VLALLARWADLRRGKRARRARPRRRWIAPSQLALTLFLCLAAILFLHPILWLADSAFRLPIDIFRVPPILLSDPEAAVRGYTLFPFEQALGRWRVGQAFLVSVGVTSASVALTLLVSSLCAYAFAFLRFRGRDRLFVAVVGLMMVPMATQIVPFAVSMRSLRLHETLAGVILPYALSPLGVFLLRQYYIKIPRELFDAARLDGAGHARIWWSVVVPLSRPALAALATFSFLLSWNDFLLPALILRANDGLAPLPLRVSVMNSIPYNPPTEAIMAAGLLAAIVPLVLFLRFQKQFIEGLMGSYGK
jgi:multiple sugar transport system permease protein